MASDVTGARQLSGISQFATLYGTQLRQLLRARKTIALCLVQVVPALAALIYVVFQDTDGLTLFRNVVEQVTFPFLVPLAALFYGGPAIVDEMEDRTLTYLTLRPIAKPLIYLGKLAAGLTVGALVVVIPMLVLFFVCLVTSDDLGATVSSLFQLGGAATLGVAAYGSVFGMLGAIFASSLISGIVYFVLAEIVLAALPVLELLSLRYYLRVVAEFNASDRLGWLDRFVLDEPISLPVWAGVMVLMMVIVASNAVASWTFKEKQYHV